MTTGSETPTPQPASAASDARLFRRRAEDRLRMALGRSDFHAHNSPLAVVEWDADFRVIRWSAEAERVFGWSASETIGRRIDELNIVHEDDRERVAALMADMVAGLAPRNVHRNRNYTKDGRVIHCEWFNSTLHDEQGKLVSVFSEVLDVTARRHAEARESRLHRVTAALSRALTPDEVAVIVLGEITSALAAGSGVVAVLDEEDRALEIVANVGFEGRELVRTVPLSTRRSPVSHVVRRATAVFLTGAGDWRARYPELAERALSNGHEAIALLPLVFEGRVVGLLGCSWREPRVLSSDERGMLAALASQCAQALERSRLFAAERAARDRTERLQHATVALAGAVAVEEVAATVLREGIPALGASGGIVFLADPDSDTLSCVGSQGFGEELCGTLRRIPREASIGAAVVARTGQPLWLGSPSERRRIHPGIEFPLADAVDGAVCILPLCVHDRVLGSLAFALEGERRFRDAERRLATAFASQAAQAFDRALLLRDLRRELAERERAEVEFRTLADAGPDIVFTADPLGRLLWYNQRCERFSGVTVEEARATGRWFGRIHPEDAEAMSAAWRHSVDHGTDFEFEARWRDTTGDYRWLLTRASPLRDAGGAIVRWLGKSTDVHEQRVAAERLAHLERLASRLASSASPDEVAQAVLDGVASALGAAGGSVTVVSDDGAHLVRLAAAGVASRAFEGEERRPMDASVPQCEAFRSRAPVLLRSRAELLERFPLLTGNVERAPYEAMASWPMVAGDSPVGTLCFLFAEARAFTADECALMDAFARQGAVSLERARLYEAERRAREEAEHARHVAEVANRAKSDFLAMMSHELRTPLNAISGYVELMEIGLRGPLTDDQRQDLARIRTAGEHLLGLINALLNHARLEAGRLTYDIEPVRVQHLLAEVEPLVLPQLQGRGLAFRCDVGDGDAVVSVDREKVRQILLNLVSNAVKFTEAGEVAIVSRREGAHVAIAVHDTGCGIPREKLATIFEPFVQVDRRLNRTSEGIGLGLAISRDLARGMGGELMAESEVGVGSTFTVTLPLAPLVALERG